MDTKTQTPHERHNREVVRILFEETWNEKQFLNLEPQVAKPVIMHFRGASMSTNVDELRLLVDYWHRAFSGLHYEIGHLIAEDDIVAVRLTITGHHVGVWEDVPPTGRAVSFSEMMFFRFADGLIVEMWEDYDEHGLRLQLTAGT